MNNICATSSSTSSNADIKDQIKNINQYVLNIEKQEAISCKESNLEHLQQLLIDSIKKIFVLGASQELNTKFAAHESNLMYLAKHDENFYDNLQDCIKSIQLPSIDSFLQGMLYYIESSTYWYSFGKLLPISIKSNHTKLAVEEQIYLIQEAIFKLHNQYPKAKNHNAHLLKTSSLHVLFNELRIFLREPYYPTANNQNPLMNILQNLYKNGDIKLLEKFDKHKDCLNLYINDAKENGFYNRLQSWRNRSIDEGDLEVFLQNLMCFLDARLMVPELQNMYAEYYINNKLEYLIKILQLEDDVLNFRTIYPKTSLDLISLYTRIFNIKTNYAEQATAPELKKLEEGFRYLSSINKLNINILIKDIEGSLQSQKLENSQDKIKEYNKNLLQQVEKLINDGQKMINQSQKEINIGEDPFIKFSKFEKTINNDKQQIFEETATSIKSMTKEKISKKPSC